MHPSRVAVKLIFFINGFVHASIAARFVRMQEIYAIDKGALGFVLLSLSHWCLIGYAIHRLAHHAQRQ